MSSYWFKVNRLSLKIEVVEVLRETAKTLVITESEGARRVGKDGWEHFYPTYDQAEEAALRRAEGEVRVCLAALERAEEKEIQVKDRAANREVEDIDLQMRALEEIGDPDPTLWRIKIKGGYYDARKWYTGSKVNKAEAPTIRSRKRAETIASSLAEHLKPKIEKA